MTQYRRAITPFFVGQLRTKLYSWSLKPGKNDLAWSKRCAEYWQLQGETFGIVFDDLECVTYESPNVVELRARVKAILPGERVANYTAPRAQRSADNAADPDRSGPDYRAS